MKKISILLFFFSIFLLINPSQSLALKLQQDATQAIPDDLDFTTIGSEEDSLANNIQKDTVKKDTVAVAKTVNANGSTTQGEEKLTLWDTFIKGLLGGFLA
ncbi:MAG: hypothetical protein EOO96_14930, partial [Pedobacter sp.]